MKIANIVYEKELVNHVKDDEIDFFLNYYNEPIEYEKLDQKLPTLYVGWSFMKACNPDNWVIQHANILKKRIVTNELYWEFSHEESSVSHVKGVRHFIENAPVFFFQSKYNYVNLDPLFFQINDMQDLMDVLPKSFHISYNYKNEAVYLLTANKIWNLNLKSYEFFKFDIDAIIKGLEERTEINYSDPEGVKYQIFSKIFPKFTNVKRYIVVFLS